MSQWIGIFRHQKTLKKEDNERFALPASIQIICVSFYSPSLPLSIEHYAHEYDFMKSIAAVDSYPNAMIDNTIKKYSKESKKIVKFNYSLYKSERGNKSITCVTSQIGF